MKLGCIADDFTGASDLGNMLARAGMPTTLCIGVPQDGRAPGTDAAVVALKTRSLPAAEAVAKSLAAVDWLREQGCTQICFKYCSTFDSTPQGNIGPVLDALAERLDARRAVVVPAFPGTGRRVFMGHLFVNDTLLNRSGMEDHPLTPMTEPDIRAWLGLQTSARVGHVGAGTVRAGAAPIRAALDAAEAGGVRYVVVDADLEAIGAAVADDVLVSGGSGLGLGLPANFGAQAGNGLPRCGRSGRAVALAGSCSRTTQAQVARHAEHAPVLHLDPMAVAEGRQTPADVAEWVLSQPADSVPLVSSTMPAEDLAAVQKRLGRDTSAAVLETFFGALAADLVARGVARLIVGGGETSGAVVSALAIGSARVGPQIAPGVPALAPEDAAFVCTLKSGNFGGPDFFGDAARVLAQSAT